MDPTPGYTTETIEDSLRMIRDRLAPAVIGLDPTNLHQVNARIDAVTPGFLDAKSTIDMACTDLSARVAGVALHTWLGGAVKDRLSFNAWIGILPPDEAARQTREWQDRGFNSCKIKVGADIRADRDRVKAVREAVGPDFNIRIDANAGYDADTSIELVKLIAPYRLQLFEQPVPADDLAGMARVRQASNVVGLSIMADESVLDHASLIHIIRMQAADIVKVKVMKQGGFLNTRRMIATAEAAGIRCVVGHGFGLGVNTMAEVMLAATSHNVIDGLECVGPLKTRDDVVTRKMDQSRGSIALPQGPGLGVMLDDAKLAQYRFDVQ